MNAVSQIKKTSALLFSIIFFTNISGAVPDILVRAGTMQDRFFYESLFKEHSHELPNKNLANNIQAQSIIACRQGIVIGALIFIAKNKNHQKSLEDLQTYTPQETRNSLEDLFKKKQNFTPKISKKHTKILALLVDKNYRNCGIGNKLLTKLLQDTPNNQIVEIELKHKKFTQFFKNRGFTLHRKNIWCLQK